MNKEIKVSMAESWRLGGWFGYIVVLLIGCRYLVGKLKKKSPQLLYKCFLPLHTERVSAYVVAAPRNKPNHISITKKIVLYVSCMRNIIYTAFVFGKQQNIFTKLVFMVNERKTCLYYYGWHHHDFVGCWYCPKGGRGQPAPRFVGIFHISP